MIGARLRVGLCSSMRLIVQPNRASAMVAWRQSCQRGASPQTAETEFRLAGTGPKPHLGNAMK
jgi:hypothetical protein